MAPEQCAEVSCTTAADVWGLGAVLFAAFVGWPHSATRGTGRERRLRGRMGHPQVLGRAPSIAGARRIASELASLVDACLEPDPVDRPAVAELARGLGGWLERGLGDHERHAERRHARSPLSHPRAEQRFAALSIRSPGHRDRGAARACGQEPAPGGATSGGGALDRSPRPIAHRPSLPSARRP